MTVRLPQPRPPWADVLLLCALWAVAALPGLGQTHGLASRELRHAEIIREMADSGDFLVPTVLGQPYHDKPPVMHVPAALLTRWAGQPSLLLARLPSAVAGLVGVLATYGIGRLWFERRAALVAGVALLAMPGYNKMAREARPDMILCAAVLLSCLALAHALSAQQARRRAGCSLLAGLAAGLGVIAKGPYGVLFPVLFAVLAPARRSEWRQLRLGWLAFGGAVAASVAAWALPVYWRDHGQYLSGVLFQRDLDVIEQHDDGYSNVLIGALLYTVPVSLFLPLALADWRRHGYSAPLVIAAAILVMVTVVPKKRPHYLLPFDPFLALGVASSIVRWSEMSRWVRRIAWTLLPVGVLSVPLYFVAVLPFLSPGEDKHIQLAREVLGHALPDRRIYCCRVLDESLAWVGRRYDQIRRLAEEESLAVKALQEAPTGSYLLASEPQLSHLTNAANLRFEIVFERAAPDPKLVLFQFHRRSDS